MNLNFIHFDVMGWTRRFRSLFPFLQVAPSCFIAEDMLCLGGTVGAVGGGQQSVAGYRGPILSHRNSGCDTGNALRVETGNPEHLKEGTRFVASKLVHQQGRSRKAPLREGARCHRF
jgi:hypothetical protein